MHGAIVGSLVIGEGLHASLGQVALGLLDEAGDLFVVAGFGVGDVIGERDFVLDIDEQMQLVAEPFDDVGDFAVVIGVLFLAAGGLGQALFDLGSAEFVAEGGASGESGGITGGVLVEIGDDSSQAGDLHVEDFSQMGEVGFFAEGGEEARHVVGAGHAFFGLDANENSQRGIASEFFKTGIDRKMSQGDGQEKSSPQGLNGIVVASFAARFAESVEESQIGDGFQQGSERLEGRRVVEFVPGEERFGDSDFQGKPPCRDRTSTRDIRISLPLDSGDRLKDWATPRRRSGDRSGSGRYFGRGRRGRRGGSRRRNALAVCRSESWN